MFKNWSIARRLAAVFTMIMVLMVTLGVIAYRAIRLSVHLVEIDSPLVEHAQRARANTLGMRRFEKDYFLNVGDQEKEKEYAVKWEDQAKRLGERLVTLNKLAQTADDRETVAAMQRQAIAYEDVFRKLEAEVQAGKIRTPQEGNRAITPYKDVVHDLEDTAYNFGLKHTEAMAALVPTVSTAARLTTWITGSILVAAVLLTMLTSYLMGRSITRQVASIRSVFNKVGMGDFAARAEVMSGDELGQVAGGLNAMFENIHGLIQTRQERDSIQENIQQLLGEISGVAEGDLTQEAEVTAEITGAIADSFNLMIGQLRKIISDVQDVTLQVSSAANEVQTTTEHLAQGSETQSIQIVDTSSAIEEIAASIQQVSDNTGTAASVATEALVTSKKGAEAVDKTIHGMEGIRQQVQETAKRIKRLGESSQEIGEIVQLIGDIADRTSILALNASIQAAMAGDAGRGFAVVAEEVERLAERSADATKRISTLIKTVQSETIEAVGAMEETTREVVSGSSVAQQAGQSLQEIAAVSQRLADLIQSISLASRQQARGSESVAKAMSEISEITQQTAAGTKQAAVSIRSLAQLADTLRDSVAAFKLPRRAA